MFRNPGFELLAGLEGGKNNNSGTQGYSGFELVEPRFNLEFEIYVQTLGFGNSMFEPRVWELLSPPWRVRTLGSGTPCSNPGFGNSMLEPRVLVVLPLPPESSNPGFGNSMFEPGVWGSLCWTPESGTSPPPGSNPGSETPCSVKLQRVAE